MVYRLSIGVMLAQQITVLARDLSQQCTVGHGHGMAKAKGSTAVGEAKGILKTKRMEGATLFLCY